MSRGIDKTLTKIGAIIVSGESLGTSFPKKAQLKTPVTLWIYLATEYVNPFRIKKSDRRKVIFAKWSGTWLSSCSYGVLVEITESTWLILGASDNISVNAAYGPVTTT